MKMNKYLRYWSIILLFIGLLFFCDNGQLVHAQDNNSVISNDEINDDIYVLVKGIEEEYNFEESITRVSKVGRELRIEIDFVYNKDSKLKTLDQMDNVREEINDAIKHIDYNKWLNVSFTGNKKWAV